MEPNKSKNVGSRHRPYTRADAQRWAAEHRIKKSKELTGDLASRSRSVVQENLGTESPASSPASSIESQSTSPVDLSDGRVSKENS